jgi:hypothetical protein
MDSADSEELATPGSRCDGLKRIHFKWPTYTMARLPMMSNSQTQKVPLELESLYLRVSLTSMSAAKPREV